MGDYPDFNISALLKGFYAGEPKPLTLDENGYIIAMLSALYAGIPKALTCDVDGNVQINVNAQGLSEIINRGMYGAPDFTYATAVVEELNTETLISLAGKGHIYNGIMALTNLAVATLDKLIIEVDGEAVSHFTTAELDQYRLDYPLDLPVTLITYNAATNQVVCNFTPGWTYESTYVVKYYHGPVPWNGSVTVKVWLYHTEL